MKLGVAAALVDGQLVPGDVEVVNGLIARVGVAAHGGRGTAVPGFIDLQVNGFAGVDFLNTDSGGYRRAGEAMLETGVTGYLPTLITSPEEVLVAAMREVPILAEGPRILGIHLEGPFLSPVRLGTHPPEARRDPDAELLARLLDAGPVRMMTLAPELRGIRPVVDLLLARGVTISCGHTDATATQANAAFRYGIRTVTHLFNAMRPLTHRNPGIAGAALADTDVIVQIINDGVHLAPETVQMIWQAAAGRVALVTDAIAGAAAPPGTYSFGSIEIVVRDGTVRGPNGVLAGSVLTMIEAVRNLHALGASFEDAVGAATSVPADVIGLSSVGRIGVGLAADVLVLDDNLELESVFVGGEARVSARG